ncbi:aminoacyl-tRNA hydrolase [Ehrlichia ruminantium]|uniref:Peptidyl-tRNA hydrolase n=1 Tax=Ehrlichia ruminantium TaxID=779 RepID=A0AAE6UI76_EHRRU|nr:aminoacyl-tRNA hydrolase [Ehrlichia ruminantium]QGR02179.1 aminoacyl-tRNA hydrolase [Ehrlichia ruminantium]QGR03100.1 aminoacyl-tRNA hydrolase [Ehrlichia ruminantium]QGR04025.1 aminoacyl-tRNA hydrolase [Ehrlichia ruminantium]
MLYLLVGLGNPGKEYELTRHNVGFMIIDAIAQSFLLSDFKKKHNALMSSGNIKSHKVILAKPYTFMNNSGGPIANIVRLYKIPLDNVIVFHDETDIDFCTIRIKQGGSSAGHNGLKSIDTSIGRNYWRIRFGIGRPNNGRLDLSHHVLSQFNNLNAVNNTISTIIEHITLLLDNDKSTFKNKIKDLIKYEDISN